ncbi:hypothetical protein LPTSP2_08670 [Leptospira ellinghausenii]|uniref:Uncharacterized protein n=1 Tax=Leptospira ellinghausenii TaxID=1917822 RepID=A0A2P2DAC6_9LEPT|nr:hypothetical protein [Leptospira ellinghausenii]GBF41589.1 hypothetical protein LPTSP2_08670 [Leptospira ellinghausenii]
MPDGFICCLFHVMKGISIPLLFVFALSNTILSQTLVEPNQNFFWESFSFQFPEPVIVKVESTSQKKLTVYPAKRDGFFMVVRILPWSEPITDKNLWVGSVFHTPIEPKQYERVILGKTFQVYEAGQVRNQNALRNQVWVRMDAKPYLWIWIQWKSDRKDLTDFFESNRFLSL